MLEVVQAKTINSREVAEMIGKDHKYILRDIEGTNKVIGIIPTLESAKLSYQDYFIESTYKSGTREYKCYECTKLGCDMLGNKLQGEKGILFTATYVKRFNEMEQALAINKFALPTTYKEALIELVKKEEEKELLLEDIKNKEILIEQQEEKVSLFNNFIDQDNIYSVNEISKCLGLKNLGRNNFYKYLRKKKILFDDKYEAYQSYVNKGYIIHRKTTIELYPGKEIETLRAYFTCKGIQWIYGVLKKDGFVINKTIDELLKDIKSEKLN